MPMLSPTQNQLINTLNISFRQMVITRGNIIGSSTVTLILLLCLQETEESIFPILLVRQRVMVATTSSLLVRFFP